ncbi:hypothetical protein LSH36_242g08048 [Paralvinella palmiformis]|uniref:Uncharacterized protein n=1 Tax=Paralvinella palmiformis TaxID=53620 RepID=A0AAD9JME2_9ANNE|nr:hypothetical protein LSH36_242g08048 [Paralvinella palmiformis]
MKISPDKLLPSKPKAIMRSQSMEAKSLEEQTDSIPGSCTSINSDVTSDRPTFKRQSSMTSLGSAAELKDIPAPVGDHKLNKEMEKLFEEYRRAEKGWFHYDDADEEVNMLSASASSTKSAPECSPSRDSRSAGTPRRTTPANKSGRRTPTTQSTSHARIRPVTPTTPLRVVARVGAASKDSSPFKSNQSRSITPNPTRSNVNATSRRDSNVGNPAVRRSRTPNPTATAGQIHVPVRCRTPLITARCEEVKPRTDTGLRKRPTTPSTSNTTPAQKAPAARSSSLSRVAINKQLGTNTLSATKRRSRSKDDILDDDGEGRRSRSDTARMRDVVRNGNRSASRDAERGSGKTTENNLIQTLREPPRSLPATPGMLSTGTPPAPVTVDIPADATSPLERPSTPFSAKPRKDDCSKPKTRIPHPTSARPNQSPTPEAGALKRFDSGVDINISPTENNSVHGDDDLCHQWQPSEAMTLAGQTLGYATVNEGSDDYY